jgi:leucyl aminopeptidase
LTKEHVVTAAKIATISTIKDLKGFDALVVGLAKDAEGNLRLEAGSLTSALDSEGLVNALTDLGATAASDEVIKVPGSTTKIIVATGLGTIAGRGGYDPEVLRRAAGAAARALAGSDSAVFSLPATKATTLSAVTEGALFGSYAFDDFRGATKVGRKAPLVNAAIASPLAGSADARKILQRATALSRAIHFVRDMINTPPSHLTPETFADEAKALVKEAGGKAAGLTVKVFDVDQLIAGGYGGIVGVGQGSANPPTLVHIAYSPARAKKRIALIGKGITFDTGGLALKPAQGMEEMKSDMSGAAAVVGAITAIAALKLPVAVDVWAAMAENMVSDTAQRPSDVLSTYGGRTVEVLNPDAEGRLVMADALVKAQEVGNRAGGLDALIDVATLTGAQMIALGTRTSAIMGNDNALIDGLFAASKQAGELFWPMPLPEELRASLDSPVADIANIGDRYGGMLVAGIFLKEFVDADQAWAHLDIAGPAFNAKSPHGYTPVGGTGVAVRTLVAFTESLAGR